MRLMIMYALVRDNEDWENPKCYKLSWTSQNRTDSQNNMGQIPNILQDLSLPVLMVTVSSVKLDPLCKKNQKMTRKIIEKTADWRSFMVC